MKTVLITGASRGIGAATAVLAAQKGYNVAVNYVKNKEAAEKTVNKILKLGGKAVAFQADVSKEKEVIDLFKNILSHFGKIDALVNNVGILENQSRLDNLEMDRLERVINTNIVSCFICSKEAIKQMSTAYGGKGGAIVNVSSIASKTGAPNEYIDYAATKGAIDALTIGLSKEVANEGIRVNAVRPGFIYSDIHAAGGEPNRVDRLKDSIPMKRGGSPIEVANAILWLLSDEASYVTGSYIDIAGGK
ncbi:SDR family oxidoreductase [Flavobacterium sp. UMI-01]|uniref:SDR family oxidoreductase n=1 Tax=Flavobacterium sp. UMI-01 TaxID=1441053 RepID=UPI001C7D9DBA|nr:SDR family oxidoreductase [Flavobacterium sp. UMI-01]GIZ09050.1 short-chain dehydrogenase [Flavobacterium sp. UMI-01]